MATRKPPGRRRAAQTRSKATVERILDSAASLFNGIWSAVQTDAELQRIDLADTLLNARQLHAISRPLLPAVDSDELMATCALLIQFALTTGLFALAMPSPLKRQMLPIFRRIMRGALDALYAENAHSRPGKNTARPASARTRPA